MMRLFIPCIGFLALTHVYAMEVFTQEHIAKYLNVDNPFIYTAIGQKYIYKEKENYQLGNFDTNLGVKYDKKDYPLSEAEFFSAGVDKPIENGMEFSLNYRKAEGTQEYNNIKTGDDGEVLFGVKIPVFSVANNISERKLNLYSSRLDTRKMDYKAQDNLRLLYSEIIQSYYALLFHNQNSILVSKLLDKAKQRVVIIEKRVNAGSLPQIALLEANQQVINRKQKLLIVQNQYENALRTFLKYLNIDITYFNQTYTLPSLLDLKNRYTSEGVSFERALENRPDLKVYANEIQKLDLENKFTSISKYPNFDIGVYGVHDFEYENGFKVTLSMDFPVERRKYTSKSLEIKSSIKNVQKLNEQKIITIKTDLNNIKNSMDALLNNIKNSEIEVELVQKLEAAEEKKYMLGSSNLFMLNQREIYTLEIQKKLLQYNLDYLQLVQESNKVMGIVFEHNL
jgi:hypothetical protein